MNFHPYKSSSLHRHLCWRLYSQYFNLDPIVGADQRKLDGRERSGTEITKKEGHPSVCCLLSVNSFCFRAKRFQENEIIAAEKDLILL